jgi:hypothetical protein
LDTVSQSLGLFLPPMVSPQPAMQPMLTVLSDSASVESVANAIRRTGQHIPDPIVASFYDFNLDGLALRLCLIRQTEPELTSTYWSFITVLVSQNGKKLPAGLTLRLQTDSGKLKKQTLKYKRENLFIAFTAHVGQPVNISALSPDGKTSNLPEFTFELKEMV